jgi:hypothetical protein
LQVDDFDFAAAGFQRGEDGDGAREVERWHEWEYSWGSRISLEAVTCPFKN